MVSQSSMRPELRHHGLLTTVTALNMTARTHKHTVSSAVYWFRCKKDKKIKRKKEAAVCLYV